MSQERKVIDIDTSVIIKKSPDCREIAHKAIAGLSEAEAIERHTIGSYTNDEDDKDEDEDGDTKS